MKVKSAQFRHQIWAFQKVRCKRWLANRCTFTKRETTFVRSGLPFWTVVLYTSRWPKQAIRQAKLSAGCTFRFPSPCKLRSSTLLSLIYFPMKSQRESESFRNTVSLNNLHEEFLTTKTKTSCAFFSSTLGCQVPWVWSLVKQSQKHQNTMHQAYECVCKFLCLLWVDLLCVLLCLLNLLWLECAKPVLYRWTTSPHAWSSYNLLVTWGQVYLKDSEPKIEQ